MSQPQMELVSEGVYVIQDSDEPVFYSDNSYWWYSGGVWYTSRVHTGGWVRVRHVPRYIGRIDRPRAYVRYHGRGHVRPAVRDHRDNRRDVRDHRDSPRRVERARPATKQQVRARDDRDHRSKRAPVKPVKKVKDNRDHRR